ncbi:MAG: ISAs1 family transposase [Oscillospiraceae bacterium]|nr:ISAs1 family transposase [Oscillospiraceae bacterium]
MQKLIEALNTLTDTRRQWGNIRHKLVDIVFIGLVSVICGGTDFEHMEDTGYAKLEWFKSIIELPNGVPDSDTFRRVFERLDPQELASVLQDTVNVEGKTVALDGKTICGSGNEQHRAYHVVSAWVTENQITLGQLVIEEKSNEIKAVPELLRMLDIEGSTVTADAMSCQKNIASKIIEKGANYVLSLKGNQQTLLEDVQLYFENESTPSHRTLEKDHGRVESREYFLETEIDWLQQKAEWAGLRGIGMVKSSVTTMKTGESREECRYFITSLTDIQSFATAVRSHWSIENQLHWQLDVLFHEDDCRARRDNSPLNLNILRKEALRRLKQTDMGKRVSLHRKMSRASMNNDALTAVLAAE